MHYLYFVAISKENASTAEEAKEEARRQLDDNGFVGQGYFSNAKADWYVIGGRWSGVLQEVLFEKDFYEEASKYFKDPHFISAQEINENKAQLQKLWRKLGGKGDNAFIRNTYAHEGYQDDAVLMTKDLLQRLKDKYKEPTFGEGIEVYFPEELEENYLKDVSPDTVENYYFVVVDYHN